jgi:hypothetical protein
LEELADIYAIAVLKRGALERVILSVATLVPAKNKLKAEIKVGRLGSMAAHLSNISSLFK